MIWGYPYFRKPPYMFIQDSWWPWCGKSWSAMRRGDPIFRHVTKKRFFMPNKIISNQTWEWLRVRKHKPHGEMRPIRRTLEMPRLHPPCSICSVKTHHFVPGAINKKLVQKPSFAWVKKQKKTTWWMAGVLHWTHSNYNIATPNNICVWQKYFVSNFSSLSLSLCSGGCWKTYFFFLTHFILILDGWMFLGQCGWCLFETPLSCDWIYYPTSLVRKFQVRFVLKASPKKFNRRPMTNSTVLLVLLPMRHDQLPFLMVLPVVPISPLYRYSISPFHVSIIGHITSIIYTYTHI